MPILYMTMKSVIYDLDLPLNWEKTGIDVAGIK